MTLPARIEDLFHRFREKTGLAGAIIAVGAGIFLVFTLILGLAVSALSQRALRAQSREMAITSSHNLRSLLELEGTLLAGKMAEPVEMYTLAELIPAGNVDQVFLRIRRMGKAAEANFVSAYDLRGNLVSSINDVPPAPAPPFIRSLMEGELKAGNNRAFLAILPADILSHLGLGADRVAPLGPGGALALLCPVAVRDEFGDPRGFLFAGRVLNGDDAFAARLARMTSAELSLLQGKLRVASSLKDREGESLTGSSVEESLVEKVTARREDVSLRASYGGNNYEVVVAPLEGRDGSVVALLAANVPIDELMARAAGIRNLIFLGGILGVVAFSLVLAVVVRRFLRPVAQILDHMQAVAAGQLGRSLEVGTRDELGAIAEATNSTTRRLGDIINRVDGSFVMVGDLVDRVASDFSSVGKKVLEGNREEKAAIGLIREHASAQTAVVDKVSRQMKGLKQSVSQNLQALKQLHGSIQEMAGSGRSLAKDSEETSAAITEMASSITQASQNAQSLAGIIGATASDMAQIDRMVKEIGELTDRNKALALELSSKATERGTPSMERSREWMGSIQTLMERLKTTVDGLNRRASEINEVINIISGIADKTNLLALNAAILASQAGKDGKGFSVVADEIRSLAESTVASIKRISGHIRNIQGETKNTAADTAEGIRLVSEGVREMGRVQEVLAEITQDAGSSRMLTEKIASLAHSHASSSSRLSEAMGGIATASRELSLATVEQGKTSTRIMEISEGLSARAEEMRATTEVQSETCLRISREVEATDKVADQAALWITDAEKGTRKIDEGIEVIRTTIEANIRQLESLASAVENLSTQADSVRDQLKIFHQET